VSGDAIATIVGNVTRDPDLKFTNSGVALASFGVAVNRRKKDAAGNWVDDDPSFFDVVAWRDIAEHCAESLQKGDRVVVSGTLRQRTWETDDGQKRSKVELVADDVGASLRFATAVITRAQRREGALTAAEEPF
jgi:single-strand DNA-binding protein